MSNSRRIFCKNSMFVGLGLALYPIASQAVIDKPQTVSKLSLAKVKNKTITVNGKIAYTNLDAAKNAVVEVWHNNSAQNHSKFEYKGKLQTDALGNYSFETDFPEKHIENGELKMRRIFFKIKDTKGNEKSTTLYIGDSGKAFVDGEHIHQTHEKFQFELPKTNQLSKNKSTIQFNLYLNS